jgi:hypothetical protein
VTLRAGAQQVEAFGGVAVSLRPRGAFVRSYDRKVSPLVRVRSTQSAAVIGNSVGTTAGVTCPGRTSFCSSCYAENLQRARPAVADVVERNTAALLAGDPVELHAAAVAEFCAEFDRYLARGLVRERDRIYRHKWDGDVATVEEARAIRSVARRFPTVRFWIYTRSLRWVGSMLGPENLTVYLSADAENVGQVRRLVERYGERVRVAACASTQAEAAEIHAATGSARPLRACPENVGRLPLVVPVERGGELVPGSWGRGACAACRICVVGSADVAFATRKR